MSVRKAWAAFAAVAAVSTLALAGCTTSTAPSGGESEGEEGGPVQLTIWQNSTTGPGQAYWREATEAFTAEHEDVTFKIEDIQNEQMDGKLQTAVQSKDMPDIFMARGGGKLADVVKAGLVKDLTDLISDDVKADYGDAPFAAFSVEGKIYGVPTAVLPGGVFYSKDLFEQAGITETPTTIDELNEAVDKLKAAGIDPIAVGAKDAWPAAHWYYWFALRSCDKDTLLDVATTKDFSDPCWLDAAEQLEEFIGTEPFNKGFLTTPAQSVANSSAGLIANHKAAMEVMGGWNVGVIADLTPDKKPLPDLGWFPFPAVDGGKGDPAAMMGGVDGFSCSVDSPSACEDFLNFLASPEWQGKYATAYSALPASAEAQEAVTGEVEKTFLAAYQESPYMSMWLDTLLGQNIGTALNDGVVKMFAGDGSAQSVIDDVTKAAERD
ncbi:ABC transporter substrate-binding protein [Microbacterium stercoris]|uniref:Extracellular solute-binding protein n=1 Tax=Microbacterium stercoris TaxID=2820289 RepID=A0A939TVY7_9MICO|nr:extracellular solute-binding protein [Microbacterium stercoris]MBO3662087.1 extracellular solute-binding protein [Microbacterium stercoris]